MENLSRGGLFADDFLCATIAESADWQALDDAALASLERDLGALLARFPTESAPNERQTEDDLIWPVLARLGWTQSLRQQNLSARGRADVPDGLLFADEEAKARANALPEEWKRYGLGAALVESKRWRRPLDRRSGRHGEETAPSTQMLRYLRRVEDLTEGALRWGILTNGACWRLYWQGARSVSEQFFELDLAALLDPAAASGDLLAPAPEARRHWLKVFALVFRRAAFLPDAERPASFHRYAIDEGRFHEERVAGDLSAKVFERVFPQLARAIAAAAPDAPLAEVREAALILLYRLLFILYAEDRDLLPVRDTRYDDYALREKVRGDVGRRMDEGDVFSESAARYWSAVDDLCRAIDAGDASIGLPPYNGGLFDRARTPLLGRVRLGDAVMADVIDALSFERTADGRRKYINYRDLGVRQLGSVYERLLERALSAEGEGVVVRPDVFARKGSGSYYTPDDLVGLILEETLGPLAAAPMEAFRARAEALAKDRRDAAQRLAELRASDPAERLLALKVCDPAMGSGHFLVNLVDWLADRTIAAMAEAEAAVDWGAYRSPLADRIEAIRDTIRANAEAHGWSVALERLDDRHVVRRMVLKRCVFGVDKNPMAVELAKVSLWLHTFTVGAPLSFLDHHLRCGDSLFGAWARAGIDKAAEHGTPLLLHDSIRRAEGAAQGMAAIEALTDAEIAEAHRSAETFAEVEAKTAPLDRILALVHAFDWLGLRASEDRTALQSFFAGRFGDPVAIAAGTADPLPERAEGRRFVELLGQARALAAEERFLNWQVAFPGVWSRWESAEPQGGFDAVIGNPPWDRVKLQQVEWFAARRPEIARAQSAADRRRMVAALERTTEARGPAAPLVRDFARAGARAADRARMARTDYPLLSGGDVNLYSLFVERAMALAKPEGVVGLLVPSGIASDKTAARFFRGVATEGRLRALYDFENRRTRYKAPPFFPDVDGRFKFCAFVAGRAAAPAPARCAFFLQAVAESEEPERRFPLAAADFARVNPNTGTAPVFRSRRDAELTVAIYGRLPVLVDRSAGKEAKAWPVRHVRMFDTDLDSRLFRTREELEEQEGAWPIDGNRFASPAGEWVPLYEGKMVQAFDHRAASVVVNRANVHRPAQPKPATLEQHRDPDWFPAPQFWVPVSECKWTVEAGWVLGFKRVTAVTNVRTCIASLLPAVGFNDLLPVFKPASSSRKEYLLAANFNSIIFDYVARQKVQANHLNLFIVEQLPVVPPARYEAVRFGPKTAGAIVRESVLELTYTAHDMAPFARALGHVDDSGAPPPPFPWDEDRRLALRARLDALFFHLYGVTDRDDVRHVYSTFSIVERQERAAHGRYRSRDLCLAWLNALAANAPDATIEG